MGAFNSRKFKKTKFHKRKPIKLDSQPIKLKRRPRKLVTVSHEKLYDSKLNGLRTFEYIANLLGQKCEIRNVVIKPLSANPTKWSNTFK